MFKKFDLTLANDPWRTRISEVRIDVLTRTNSDHHLIFINTSTPNDGTRKI
ncbi:hypothetical protein AHAS_Ahas12G0158400 [Arachis hypogaea]